MLDSALSPGDVKDSLATLRPADVPRILWTHIEPYLTSYNVTFTEAYPRSRVERPTIVWRLKRRIPGISGSPYRHKKGSNFSQVYKNDDDGNVQHLHTQTFTVFYEFAVYGLSTVEADDLAWDFENALLEAEGPIQSDYAGLKIVFHEQDEDSSLSWRQQDELIVRHLIFEIVVPVRRIRTSPRIRSIQHVYTFGKLGRKERVTRASAELRYDPPVAANEFVVGIDFILLNTGSTTEPYKLLHRSVDYEVKKDSNQTVYVEWNDTYGLTPIVGQEFVITYDTSQRLAATAAPRETIYPG